LRKPSPRRERFNDWLDTVRRRHLHQMPICWSRIFDQLAQSSRPKRDGLFEDDKAMPETRVRKLDAGYSWSIVDINAFPVIPQCFRADGGLGISTHRLRAKKELDSPDWIQRDAGSHWAYSPSSPCIQDISEGVRGVRTAPNRTLEPQSKGPLRDRKKGT
jgi:hypothetical protein